MPDLYKLNRELYWKFIGWKMLATPSPEPYHPIVTALSLSTPLLPEQQ
jgi:hypothetical protein